MTTQRARTILALPPDAGADEIESAFRHAIRLAHPDRGGDPACAQLLLDARTCLRKLGAGPPASFQRVVVVPALTGRGLVTALVLRVRRAHPRPPRVR